MSLIGYNLYIPVYLQEQLGLSPLQSGFVILPLSVAWIILNFNLAKIEANFTRKALYLGVYSSLNLQCYYFIWHESAIVDNIFSYLCWT